MHDPPREPGLRMPWEYGEDPPPAPADAALLAGRRRLEAEVAVSDRWRVGRATAAVAFIAAGGDLIARSLDAATATALCLVGAVGCAAGAASARAASGGARIEVTDARLLGAIAEICHHPAARLASAALAALRRLLPLAGPAQAPYLSSDEVHALLWLLYSPDPALVRSILAAVERMRDPRARWELRRFAGTGRGWQEAGWSERDRQSVRRAACGCLAAIEAAARQQCPAPRLLRPARAPDTISLLPRPAAAPGQAPELLLRPPQ